MVFSFKKYVVGKALTNITNCVFIVRNSERIIPR